MLDINPSFHPLIEELHWTISKCRISISEHYLDQFHKFQVSHVDKLLERRSDESGHLDTHMQDIRQDVVLSVPIASYTMILSWSSKAAYEISKSR